MRHKCVDLFPHVILLKGRLGIVVAVFQSTINQIAIGMAGTNPSSGFSRAIKFDPSMRRIDSRFRTM